jgi:predicted DNA-binding transcriptional regulator YafY
MLSASLCEDSMRRAERLFQIIQILRRGRAPITADALAQELETSKRSIYRDIAALVGQRAPIRGEAGVGYVLEDGYDMPPLMLTPDEIEAAVLGAQWVAGRGDPALARAANDLIAKIAEAVPDNLRPIVLEPSVRASPTWENRPDNIDMVQVRAAIHAGRKIRLAYRDEQDQASERVIWPITVGYMDTRRLLIGWCELRTDFRTFRTDRIAEAAFLEERFPERPGILRAKYRRAMEERHAGWKG